MMPCQLSKLEQINFQYGYSEPFQEQFPVWSQLEKCSYSLPCPPGPCYRQYTALPGNGGVELISSS